MLRALCETGNIAAHVPVALSHGFAACNVASEPGVSVDRFRWDLGMELPGDRDLVLEGDGLNGRHVSLLVSGGIAAYRSPDLIRALRRQGAQVQVYVTPQAFRFVTKDVLEWCSLSPVIEVLDGRAQHVEDARETDLYLLAPATYSTINKFALGLADNAVTTTLASALGRLERNECKIQVVPTMHGSMVNEVLRTSLERLEQFGVEIVAPRPGAGKANLPDVDALVAGVERSISGLGRGACLAGARVLVTGGPTPVALDDVRVLTNRYSGRTAVGIAESFYRAGADVELLLSGTLIDSPSWIPTRRVSNYSEYKSTCLDCSADLAIFSAAVADYRPKAAVPGKVNSGLDELRIELEPTEKVLDLWKEKHSESQVVSFKLEADLTDQELLDVARRRLGEQSDAVVANHASGGSLYLVDANGETLLERDKLGGALVDWFVNRR